MLNVTDTATVIKVVIRISRDYEYYYYSRSTNGETNVLAARISKARAREIMEAFPGQGQTIGHEQVNWDDGAKQWTYVIETEEVEDGE